MIRRSGGAVTRLPYQGNWGAFVVLPLFISACVSAPPEIVRTFDAALESAERFRSYSVEVQESYRHDLAAAWARERSHIMKAEIEKRKDDAGKIDAVEIEELIAQEKAAAKRHAEQLEILEKRDAKAGKNWQAFRESSEALRRYLASGMSAEERAELFEVIASSAERMVDDE